MLTPVKLEGELGKVSESERNSIIVVQCGSIRFPTSSCVLKERFVKGDCYRKSRHFTHFIAVKFREVVSEMSD